MPKPRLFQSMTLVLITALLSGCSTVTTGGSYDRNRLTAEDIASLDVSTVYEVVQRLRPRWLEVRSSRGMETETRIVVFLHRTYLGGPDELRRLGVDTAEWLEYRSGSDVVGELSVPGSPHVEGAIIVHTSPPESGSDGGR